MKYVSETLKFPPLSAVQLILLLCLCSCSLNGKIQNLSNKSLSSSPAGSYKLSVSDSIVNEYGVASLIVSLSQPYSEDITFNYYTQDQTASSGTDYASVAGSATIPAGQTQVVISVPIADNMTKASNKKFLLNLSNLSSSKVELSNSTSVVEIKDDDYDPITGFVLVSVGSNHACALTNAGGVKCWGSNGEGNLGDGTTIDRLTPVDVSGLSTGVVAIAVGDGHTCALTSGGGVKCWGPNYNGELGDGTTNSSSVPVNVVGLTSGVASIDSGSGYSCAVTTTGAAKCWGANNSGQLGDGGTTSSTNPVNVTGLSSGVSMVKTGEQFTCAIQSGAAKCWGANWYGQLGDGTSTNRLTAVSVSSLSSAVTDIDASSEHACAIQSGAAKCWGRGAGGKLGNNGNWSSSTPVAVTGLISGVTQISTGYYRTCALVNGGAKCWGQNGNGELGDGTSGNERWTAVDVSGLTSGVTSVSSGRSLSGFACASLSTGLIKCWGNNGYIGVGDNYLGSLIATDVSGISSGSTQASASMFGTCAIVNGGVKCWGTFLLGDGTSNFSATPVNVSGLTSGVVSVALGNYAACAITNAGALKCWGQNYSGQLGDGTSTQRLSPVDVTGLSSGTTSVTVGSNHNCAVVNGGAKCWGANWDGQLGDSTTVGKMSPVDVTGLTSGVVAVTAGDSFACALTTSNTVKCWGKNDYGQLGDNSYVSSSIPVTVLGLSNVKSISAGVAHMCALTFSGNLKCWGGNGNGQLGDGTYDDHLTAFDVPGISGVSALSSGNYRTCVLTTSGGVKCWGTGPLGDGTSDSSLTPIDVSGIQSGVLALASGHSHTCAVLQTGGMKCWGSSSHTAPKYNTLVPRNVVSP